MSKDMKTWIVTFRSVTDQRRVWRPIEVEAVDIVDAACMAQYRCKINCDGEYVVTGIRVKE